MFDGYRPISAFILLACLFVLGAVLRARARQKGGIALVIFSVFILAFTRADVAFLYAVSALALVSLSLPLQILLLCIPVAAQAALSFVLFPDAEYFSEVFMLTRNLTSPLILLSPLTPLMVALGIAYRHEMAQLARFTWQRFRIVGMAMLGYVITLFVISMPNEYRLFLPLLPLVLFLTDEYRNA